MGPHKKKWFILKRLDINKPRQSSSQLLGGDFFSWWRVPLTNSTSGTPFLYTIYFSNVELLVALSGSEIKRYINLVTIKRDDRSSAQIKPKKEDCRLLFALSHSNCENQDPHQRAER